jgi:predicted DNA-binding transcriptional regulator AlpA
MIIPSPLLNEHDVAAVLNMKVGTLRRWRWAGRGPRFVKVGAAVRYDPADINSYIEGGRRRSTSDLGAVVR